MRKSFLVDKTGILRGLKKIGLTLEDVVAQAHGLRAVGGSVRFRSDQAVTFARERVVGEEGLLPGRRSRESAVPYARQLSTLNVND